MKKHLCIILVLMLALLASLAVCASAADITFGESTEYNATVRSDAACSDLSLFAAVYDGNKLVGIKKVSLDLKEGENNISTGADFGGVKRNRIKLLIWNDSMKPSAQSEYTVNSYSGIVTQTPLTQIAEKGTYNAYSKNTITISGSEEYTFDCAQIENPESYLGKYVTALVKDGVLYGLEVDNRNQVTSITDNQLIEEGDKYYDEYNVVAYREVGEYKVTALDIANDVEIYCNYAGYEADSEIGTWTVKSLLGNGGRAELISNDGDDRIDVINVLSYTDEAVISAVYDVYGEYLFEFHNGYLPDIDTTREDVLINACMDGKKIDVTELKADTAVSWIDVASDGTCTLLYCTTETVEGMVSSYDEEYAEINGVEYSVSNFTYYGEPAEVGGLEGVFFLNVDGKITGCKQTGVESNYSIVLAVAKMSGINGGYEIQTVNAEGEKVVYSLASKAVVLDCDGNTITRKDDQATAEYLYGYMDQEGSSYRVRGEMISDCLYDIKVNESGSVLSLTKLNLTGTAYGEEFDADKNSYGSISFDENTLIFSVDATGADFIEPEHIKVRTLSDIMIDGEGANANITAFNQNRIGVAEVVIGFDIVTEIPRGGNVLVVSGVRRTEYKGEEAFIIDGMHNGENVSYTLYNEDGWYYEEPSLLTKGDVILVGRVDENNLCNNIELVYHFGIDGDSFYQEVGLTGTNEQCYYGMLGDDTGCDENQFYIEGDDVTVTMDAEANYILVDYSESIKLPSITAEEASKSIFGNRYKYNSEVFVRYYKDKLQDVVVFRTQAE